MIADESTGYHRRDRFLLTGGAWSFAEVPAGNYTVQVSGGAGGFSQVKVAAGQEVRGVSVLLEPLVPQGRR